MSLYTIKARRGNGRRLRRIGKRFMFPGYRLRLGRMKRGIRYRRIMAGRMRTGGFYGRFSGRHAELKFHDLDIDDTFIASGATILVNSNAEASLCRIAQGNSESERIGRKVTIRSINWRFNIDTGIQTDTAAPNNDTVRVILYLDKQCNGAAATAAQILASADFQSFNNLANKSRFRTLMDRTYTLNLVAASGADATAEWKGGRVDDSLYKRVNIPIEYDNTATTGALATIRSNNIGVLVLGVSGSSVFNSKFRLRYSDV